MQQQPEGEEWAEWRCMQRDICYSTFQWLQPDGFSGGRNGGGGGGVRCAACGIATYASEVGD
eukprot:3710241-Rhodomonas_salina.1